MGTVQTVISYSVFQTDLVFFLNPCCIPLKIQYIYDNICVNKCKYLLVKPNLSAYLAWSGTLECFVVGVQSKSGTASLGVRIWLHLELCFMSLASDMG